MWWSGTSDHINTGYQSLALVFILRIRQTIRSVASLHQLDRESLDLGVLLLPPLPPLLLPGSPVLDVPVQDLRSCLL